MSEINKNRRAFTLIELLVSISILAILVSILLPAIAAARVEGIKTKCLTNLRGLAQTATAYSTDDPRGVYGAVHPRASDYTGEGYADYGGGPGIVRIERYKPHFSVEQPFMWGQAFGPETRPFNQIIYGVEGMAQPLDNENPQAIGDASMFQEFRCPGEDFGYQEWPSWQSVTGCPSDEIEHPYFHADGTSYRFNNLIWKENDVSHWVDGVYARSITQIPDTSLTIGFMEARAFQTLATNEVWGALPVHGELTGYHKKLGYFNVSYVDGHVAFVDMGNGTFFPQTLERSFYDVRGKWGRMDCLMDKMFLDP